MYQIMRCLLAILLIFVVPVSLEASRAILGPIIKIPPDGGNKDLAYHELICTQNHRNQIEYIITTIASNNKVTLLFLQGDLKRAGAMINEVHPLKFLETIFCNPVLKELMPKVESDYFKWTGFLDGLVPSLTNQANQGKLLQYLNDFAKRVNSPPDALATYFHSKDWENLVRYLITH